MERINMVKSYTAKYTKISSGYMGQVVEWPEVITEGKTIEECRELLKDALQEMMAAYKIQGKEFPLLGTYRYRPGYYPYVQARRFRRGFQTDDDKTTPQCQGYLVPGFGRT